MQMAKPNNTVVEKPTRIGVRVDSNTYNQLKTVAETGRRSMSDIVRFAIEDYLNNHQQPQIN